MKWDWWLQLYLERHCTARGLASRTIAAYAATLDGFRRYVRFRLSDRGPDELSARDILEYVEYLRRERQNGPSAVNRQVTILKNFYRAMVAMGMSSHGAFASNTMPGSGVAWGPASSSNRMMVTFANISPAQTRLGFTIQLRPFANA